MSTAHPDQTGLSLVELIIALALAAVLAAIAVPAMGSLLLGNRMTAHVNALVHGIHVAHQTAHLRGVDVVLCPSSDHQACDGAGDWSRGFIVFANTDRDEPPTRDAGERLLDSGASFAPGRLRANRRAFVFRSHGRRSVNGTFTFCDRRGSAHARAVIVSYSGRPRAASSTAANDSLTCVG